MTGPSTVHDSFDPNCPTRRREGGHWLTFDGPKVIGCVCGYIAEEDDCGFGDSVLRHFRTVVQDETLRSVRDLIRHARLISPSERAVIYVAQLERALGIDAAVPHKTGQNDGGVQ